MKRAFFVTLTLPLSILALVLALAGTVARSALAPPEGPFRAWDGAWEGTFTTYRTDGTRVSTLRVKQTYRSESDDLQTGEFEDTAEDGTVVRSIARNVREKDGTLLCEVTRVGTGKKTVHRGRLEDGFLFWFRRVEEEHLEECFRERVTGGATYEIEGVGVYGERRETVLLFSGRYERKPLSGR